LNKYIFFFRQALSNSSRTGGKDVVGSASARRLTVTAYANPSASQNVQNVTCTKDASKPAKDSNQLFNRAKGAESREQGTVCRKQGAKGASRMTTKDTAAAAPAGPQDARRERERRPQGLCLRMQVGENSWRTKTEQQQQQRQEGPMSGRRKDILCRQTHILTNTHHVYAAHKRNPYNSRI